MRPETIVGYVLLAVILVGAIGPGIASFIDVRSTMIVLGGTFALVLIGLGIHGKGRRANLYLWQLVTVGLFVGGFLGTLVGLILMLEKLNDPGSIGPAMAIALLTDLYALICLAVLSFPIEDRLNKELKRYDEFSLSRAVWFGYPLIEPCFLLLAFFVLFFALSTL